MVGLEQTTDGWDVLAQGPGGPMDLSAASVVVATGGYVQPREHLGISGPRPSGIMTADLVHAVVDGGMAPGRRAALVGGGRLAEATRRRLEEQGCAVVVELGVPPDAVRGEDRLEAVLANGTWHEVDTLVLCARWLPQAFFLRGLGLLDSRPGQVVPTDDHGLVLRGLWATGTCVRPDIEHRDSLTDGRRVGGAVVATKAPTT